MTRGTIRGTSACGALAAALAAVIYAGVLLPRPPPASTDPAVLELSKRFEAALAGRLSISSVGELKRDRDTAVWAWLSDHFGSNPNTPYMFNVFPLYGWLLPSPIYPMRRDAAVVLLSRLPPRVEYFSFTTFAAWIPRRGVVFSSLADSVNNHNINATPQHPGEESSGLFAHVVTADASTLALVRRQRLPSPRARSPRARLARRSCTRPSLLITPPHGRDDSRRVERVHAGALGSRRGGPARLRAQRDRGAFAPWPARGVGAL